MIFHENRLLADDSHEISYLIFLKIGKDVAKLSSAAVVIGALRVNNPHPATIFCLENVVSFVRPLHIFKCT